MIAATGGADAFQGVLFMTAWAMVCRAGAYHGPHSHPDSAWSGVYVDAGSDTSGHPFSGVLEFLDLRSGVEAVTAPGDTYGEPFRVRPRAGLMVIFPSWLCHWVHPYAGQTQCIAISFYAALGPTATPTGTNGRNTKLASDPVKAQFVQEETSHGD